jgi:hypothetical protein
MMISEELSAQDLDGSDTVIIWANIILQMDWGKLIICHGSLRLGQDSTQRELEIQVSVEMPTAYSDWWKVYKHF